MFRYVSALFFGGVYMDHMEQGKNGVQKTKYERIIETEKFKVLMNKKKKFLIPLIIFFLLFYFALPILASYTKLLHQPAIGDITWVWVFSLAQFIMTWTLATIYMRKSEKFDRLVSSVVEEEFKEGGEE